MVPIIQQEKWLKWCHKRQLDINNARFALETCYYGVGLRSRPGTLLLTDSCITHFSYSFWDTWWAIFEKSIKIDMPLQQVSVVRRLELDSLNNTLQYQPDAYFQVEMADGTIHHLILQREGDKFAKGLYELKVRVE